MSQRSELENKHTVRCIGCNTESIDPSKTPAQKYPKVCANCGRTNKDNQRLARKGARMYKTLESLIPSQW